MSRKTYVYQSPDCLVFGPVPGAVLCQSHVAADGHDLTDTDIEGLTWNEL